MAVADIAVGEQLEPQRAVIGPNAILQTEAALRAAGGDVLVEAIFAKAGLSHFLIERPNDMIDETAPIALFKAIFQTFPRRDGMRIALDAGRRTGRYILANRIPVPVRWILKALPPGTAAPILLKSIERHAWTFAGSGDCRVETGDPARLIIANNPMKMPCCAWHVGVFEVLFRDMVSAKTRVAHFPSRRGEPDQCTIVMDWHG